MSRTYRAILHDDRVEWLEQPPEQADARQVRITVLDESAPEPPPLSDRGRMMAEVLAELAERGTFATIPDPVAWQREIRAERDLPDRDA